LLNTKIPIVIIGAGGIVKVTLKTIEAVELAYKSSDVGTRK
jgi:hypothetical protein